MATPISEKMEALGFTDGGLAAAVGCERSMITKIKLGKANPSLGLAVKLGALLALPAESFFIPKPDATPSETGQGRAVA